MTNFDEIKARHAEAALIIADMVKTLRPLDPVIDAWFTDRAWLIAEVERMRAEETWQPIKTAPKEDGFQALVYCADVTSAGFLHGAWWDANDIEIEPTHWRPLPLPPKAAA